MDSNSGLDYYPLPEYANPSGGLDSFTRQDMLDRGEPLQGMEGTIYRRQPGEMVMPRGGNPPRPFSPQVPESFTPADDLELQKYQQALARVRQDKYDGDITDEDHAAVESEIQSRMAPLIQGKQKQMEQMQQLQETQLMRQSGMAQAIKHANEKHDANFFPEKTPWLTDPMTGRSVALRPNGPSKWQEVEFPPMSHQEAGEGGGEGGDEVGGPADVQNKMRWLQSLPEKDAKGGPTGGFDETPEGQTGGFDERPQDQDGPRVKEAFQPAGGFKPTESQMQVQQAVRQGKGISRYVAEQAKKDRLAQLDGRPRDTSMTQAQTNALWDQAENTVRLPPGPHRDHAVAALALHLISVHTREQQHIADQQARQGAAAQRQAHKEQQEKREALTTHMLDLAHKQTHAEMVAHNKDHPDDLWGPPDTDDIHKRARELLDAHDKLMGKPKPDAAKPAAAPAESAASSYRNVQSGQMTAQQAVKGFLDKSRADAAARQAELDKKKPTAEERQRQADRDFGSSYGSMGY